MLAEERLQTIDVSLNMGPQHPSTHGVFRMTLKVDGERVLDVEPYIGYLHRGTEKLSENVAYRHVVTYMERADYLANFNNAQGWVMAVEKLMGTQVPERAEYIRVLLCELQRIASHMMLFSSLGADAGVFATSFMYGFRDREFIEDFFESVTGSRMMHNYFRVGGVKEDLLEDYRERMAQLVPKLRRGIEDCDHLLTNNEIFAARTQGIGAITAKDAISYGMSGPMLRACGVPLDIRRAEPYSIYPRLDFEVPIRHHGDTYDRFVLRVEEMRQSLRIVEQCLEQMPEGPVMGEVPRTLRPRAGEVYVRTENPRGDFGVYLVSAGGLEPYRVKVRAPSFCNLMALRQMLQGCYVADCVVVLGSFDIVLGEVDR